MLLEYTTALTTDDGYVVDAARNARGFFDITFDGVLISHAMVPTTAQITMEEAVRCWNEEAGLYVYEGENPFPQYMPDMVAHFPQHTSTIMATVRKRRNKDAATKREP